MNSIQDPKAICSLVKVCDKTSNSVFQVTPESLVVPEIENPENGVLDCFLCKFVAKSFSKIIDVPKTEVKKIITNKSAS